MELMDAVLLTIKAAGGSILGRTTIQKLIYFESILGFVDAKYRPHYYGPYSAEVSGTIQELIYLDFMKEEIETRGTTGFSVSDDWKRYCYTLSKDGQEIVEQLKKENTDKYDKIIALVEICKETVNLDVETLSWAAKVHYILSGQGRPMTREEIINVADSFGWRLSQSQINDAVELLKQLKL